MWIELEAAPEAPVRVARDLQNLVSIPGQVPPNGADGLDVPWRRALRMADVGDEGIHQPEPVLLENRGAGTVGHIDTRRNMANPRIAAAPEKRTDGRSVRRWIVMLSSKHVVEARHRHPEECGIPVQRPAKGDDCPVAVACDRRDGSRDRHEPFQFGLKDGGLPAAWEEAVVAIRLEGILGDQAFEERPIFSEEAPGAHVGSILTARFAARASWDYRSRLVY
jgi:hypothetical protein